MTILHTQSSDKEIVEQLLALAQHNKRPDLIEQIHSAADIMKLYPYTERNNEAFIEECVRQNPLCLAWASAELRDNSSIVEEAVAEEYLCILFASERLQHDIHVLFRAIRDSACAWAFVPRSRREDIEWMRGFLKVAVKFCGAGQMRHAPFELRNDRSYMLELLPYDCRVLRYASFNIRNDKEWIDQTLRLGYSIIRYATSAIRNDLDMAVWAVYHNPYAFFSTPHHLKQNKVFILNILWQHPHLLHHVPKPLCYDPDIVMLAIRQESIRWT